MALFRRLDGFAGLLPETVEVAVAAPDTEPPPLFPEEEDYVAKAVSSRRREFALGRHCARLALRRLGIPLGPIPVGPNRQPEWPAEVVGSITHCQALCAAAVARKSDVTGLGIDAEPAAPLPADVVDLICTPFERSTLAAASLLWTKLIFSAKESVFKCTFPLTELYLGFLDAEVSLQPGGTFTVRSPLMDMRGIVGRYAVTDRHVLTTAVLSPVP